MTSLAPPSPQVCRAKRGRHSTELDFCSPHGKRHRLQPTTEVAESPSFRLNSIKQRLQSLFVGMDEKIIARVLDSCQGDFDAALEKLTELSLTTSSSPACEPTAERPDPATQHHSPVAVPPQKPCEDTSKPDKHAVDSSQSVDEVQRWTVALRDEVSAAVDTEDLHRKIFHFLTLCKQHIESTQAESSSTQLQDLQNQNAVLKKAVAIQHARLGKSTGEKDAQIQHMQGLLTQYQSRIQNLEAANYALSLHLKQATNCTDMFRDHPPDVF